MTFRGVKKVTFCFFSCEKISIHDLPHVFEFVISNPSFFLSDTCPCTTTQYATNNLLSNSNPQLHKRLVSYFHSTAAKCPSGSFFSSPSSCSVSLFRILKACHPLLVLCQHAKAPNPTNFICRLCKLHTCKIYSNCYPSSSSDFHLSFQFCNLPHCFFLHRGPLLEISSILPDLQQRHITGCRQHRRYFNFNLHQPLLGPS